VLGTAANVMKLQRSRRGEGHGRLAQCSWLPLDSEFEEEVPISSPSAPTHPPGARWAIVAGAALVTLVVIIVATHVLARTT
jgi:hypothetical protein